MTLRRFIDIVWDFLYGVLLFVLGMHVVFGFALAALWCMDLILETMR